MIWKASGKSSEQPRTFPVRRAVFPFLLTALVMFVGVSALAFVRVQRQWLENSVRITQSNVESYFNEGLSSQVHTMRTAMYRLTDDAVLMDQLAAKDRSALLQRSSGYYDRLRHEHGITHLYFHDADGVNVLRVHTPSHYGDKIKRITLAQAARTKEPSSGLELGPFGFVLRVVQPVVRNGTLIGFVELGRELDSLLSTIEGSLGLDLTPFIQKRKLDRASWEESNLLFSRQTDWDRFAQYAPVGKAPDLAQSVDALLQDGPAPPYLMSTSSDARKFAYAIVPLHEMGGEAVGRLVITREMTDLEQQFRQALTLWSGIVLAISVLVLAVAKWFLGRLDQRLGEANTKLRLAHDTLEDRVKARTRELTEQIARREAAEVQLRQAQKMETVGQLTGGIAHDFNNLLTVIIGNIDLLTLEPLKPASRTMAQETLKAAERAASLTRQLLAVSRRQVLQPRSLDPSELVQGLEGLLQRALGETIRVQITAAQGGWSCCADAAQLESALLNLAVNARDAMPDGGVLDVRVLNETLRPDVIENLVAGDYVVFEVEDSGVGMDSALLERAFEPFFTTKDLGAGSGLGLSMVYGFAKQSGGLATIVSTVGHGTRVRLYLPRSEPGATADTSHHGRQVIAAGNGERILVVEDDPQVRLYACRMLHELGYRTYEGGDASDALRVLEQQEDVALVFSDLVLPGGGSGMDLKRTVAKQHPGIPVLLTSGYTADKLDDDADVDIIEKPYRREILAVRIALALRGAHDGYGASGELHRTISKTNRFSLYGGNRSG